MLNNKLISGILQGFIWIPIVFFSSLLIHNSLLYYSFDQEYGILPEKSEALKDPIWIVSFYVHVITGVICLSIPIFSFLGRRVGLSLSFHKKIGLLYVWISILIIAPTGMYLALYANGGFLAQSGFLAQGILLSLFTYKGYKAIQEKNTSDHIQWMIRSYAIVTAVLSFRIFHIIFFFTSIPYEDIYGLSQWLSILVNLLLAEFIIAITINSKKTISTLN